MTKSPVHQWAQSRGFPIYTSIKDFDIVSKPDFIIVAAYGVILRDNVLSAAPCINIHPSDLPKYRGASPITSAIYNGDKESAVCLMQVAAAVDSGDIYMRRKFEIGENETAADIENKVSAIGSEMLIEYLRTPEIFPPVPQMGEPTFTRKWIGEDELIDWGKAPQQIHNQVRAIGGRTKINGIDVKILETKLKKCSKCNVQSSNNCTLEILLIQPSGKNPMSWHDFVNGQRGAEIKFGE
jgi:methionyl-tRNA formyltransferase